MLKAIETKIAPFSVIFGLAGQVLRDLKKDESGSKFD